jgi:hypothetical protein
LNAAGSGKLIAVKNDNGLGHVGSSDRLVERAAAAEINGRRVNEAIERGAEKTGTAVFVCECGVLGCTAKVEMSISDYERVRSGFERFLVVPGHEIEAIEDVVERHAGYLVVAKQGKAGDLAGRTDSRGET